jgi:hypothetical protein
VISVTSAKEAVECLLDLKASEGSLVFRGQSDAEWGLVPSAWREGGAVARRAAQLKDAPLLRTPALWGLFGTVDVNGAVASIVGNVHSESHQRVADLASWLLAERGFVEEFSRNCDLAGLSVPGVSKPHQFAPLQFDQSQNVPKFLVSEAFALAQHYGVPTRLLDFSDQPLKALYFAAVDLAARPVTGLLDAMELHERSFCVWALTAPQMDIASMFATHRLEEMRVLRSSIRYLLAQDGLFLLSNSTANRYFINNGRWPDLQELRPKGLRKVVIPWKEAGPTMTRLACLGIDGLRLQPSYETAARHTLGTS